MSKLSNSLLWVHGKAFNRLTSVAIIICSVILGVETTLLDVTYITLFKFLDLVITCFFVIEIVLRILAEPSPHLFFRLAKTSKAKKGSLFPWRFTYIEQGVWNWFDFIITVISVAAIFTHFFEHPEYLLVGRMFRVFRIFRLLEVSEQLRAIEKKIVSVIPTVFSFALLLFILIYIHAIIGYYMFHGTHIGPANFSSLFDSIVTLFKVMTLDGWGEIMDASLRTEYVPVFVIYIYYVVFVGLTAIISLNVFIAVLASSIEDKMSRDIQASQRNMVKAIKKESENTEMELDEAMRTLMQEIRSLREEVSTLSRKR